MFGRRCWASADDFEDEIDRQGATGCQHRPRPQRRPARPGEDLRGAIREHSGRDFPQDPRAAGAGRPGGLRLVEHRARHDLPPPRAHPSDLGTAVNIGAMVFGNGGMDSGTGVAFTRDPPRAPRASTATTCRTRRRRTVAGSATPCRCTTSSRSTRRLRRAARHHADASSGTTATCATSSSPSSTASSGCCRPGWEANCPGGVQDRFRPGRRGPHRHRRGAAAGDGAQLPTLMFPGSTTGRAAPARHRHERLPGAAVGRPSSDSHTAAEWAERGEDVILVRRETNPDDLRGMVAARGILTSRGGKTSHAAVVARGMGRTCVCGAESLDVDVRSPFHLRGRHGRQRGRRLSRSTGRPATSSPVRCLPPTCSWRHFEGDTFVADETVRAVARLMEHADRTRRLGGAGQCRYPGRLQPGARRFGAQDRTMPDRAHAPRRPSRAGRAPHRRGSRGGARRRARRAAPRSSEDFTQIFEAMDGPR